MIDCFVTPAASLGDREIAALLDGMTRPGSDFSKQLEARSQSGTIALCMQRGEIVGWARSERWQDNNTLEAFVAENWRSRGIAAFAASGLYATGMGTMVAVFAPPMLLVARRAGFYPILYVKEGDSWIET